MRQRTGHSDAHMHRKWTRQSSTPGGSRKMAGSLKRLRKIEQ